VANVIVSALATWNGKALKKGKQDLNAFDKTVKSLGKTFAGVFAASKLLTYSKNAVKAFMADEKAAKSLEIQLKNTGFAFASPSVEYYIANLQKATGVLDDQLRPAFQQLLTVTGSITKSQNALNTALDVSAATGKSVTEVAAALSRGYAGNTTGLSRLGAGLTKATLKTGDMDKILGELNQKFSGQAAARLDTYAGKMDLLKVASANASEEVGKGLLDALSVLGKDKSIATATDAMEGFAKSIGDALYGIGLLVSKLDGLASKIGSSGLSDLLLRLQPGGQGAKALFDVLSSFGASNRNQPSSNFTYDLGSSATKDIERAKLILEANKARAKENKLIKEKNALETLKMKYDVERTGLMLALNQATDEETRVRIAEKLAILDGNAAKAQQYLADIELTNQTDLLAKSMNQAANAALYFSDWATYRAGERGDASVLSNTSGGGGGGGGMVMPSAVLNTQNSDWQAYRAGERAVTVNVAGSVLTDQDLTDTIQRTILQINKQGRGTTPAGGLSGGT
jgi:hypothetical protein